MRRLAATAVTTLVLVMTTPGIAEACNVPLRTIGPIKVSRHDLRRPVMRTTEPRHWNLDDSWTSVEPQLNQTLRTRRIGTYANVGFAAQRALSIDALPPDTYGWRWVEDVDAGTTCPLVGQHAWEPPTVRVSEGPREIRVIAVSRRTPGDATGCVLEDGASGLPCPNLTLTIRQLSRPIGSRQLVFEHFGPSSGAYSPASSGRT